MIPNETHGEISRNNFVQLKLGELSSQPECTFIEDIEKPPIKRNISYNLDKETTNVLEKYRHHLDLNYRKKTTILNYYYYVRLFLRWINKPLKDITHEDMLNWKGYLIHTFKKNGNARRVMSVNHFTKWLERSDLKIPVPSQEHSNKIVLSEQELNQYIKISKENPLWHMIALFQIDGLLRPSEFSILKISTMDLDNQTFYLDDTKTGNNYIILSPRLVEAIKEYLLCREPLQEYEDYLVIIPHGTYKGKAPQPFGGFIKKQTKLIAQKAGITKYVAPYIIKPSSITCDFNKQVNPKIIQRKARHRKIETTLQYNHVSDEMVREYFTNISNNIK
ncbi:MAG: tyrosine-type recombinase/integrase [Actinobacteria bacterium]|nr:tyrosine-type recombinase/integrase [Actinomycetota bacterium]MBE3121140.1 tyrosine-type recombinase/integrase [Thermoplasmata archaeon]